MFKTVAAAAAGLVLMGAPAWAETGNNSAQAMAMVKAADAAIGASKTKSIHYGGSDGYVTVYGQSYTSSVQHQWPRFDLDRFDRVIDYDTMSMREDQLRSQGAWPVAGGGDRPIVGQRHLIHFYRDGYAWNQNPDGSVTAVPQDAARRMLEIVMTPVGFIRAAEKAHDLHMDTHFASSNSVAKVYAIEFKYQNKYPITGWIDEDHHVVKITTWFFSPMVGDEYVETRYAHYKDYGNGFAFGPTIHQSIGVPPDPSYDFEATTVAFNVPNAVVQVPASVRRDGGSTADVQTKQLAPGTWLVGANGYYSAVLEFAKYIAVIEAPLDEKRSDAVMAEARRLIPNKPIRYVVNTHHAYDIAGGLRGYAAEDVLIVTQQSNYDNYESLALALHSQQIDPDQQARAPRQVHYIRMLEHWTMTDGQRKLEVYHVEDQDKSEDMLMAYLPAEKILFETDMYDPLPAGQTDKPTDANMALLYNIERVSIEPEHIVSMRSGEVPIAKFLGDIGVDRLIPRGQGLDARLNDMRP